MGLFDSIKQTMGAVHEDARGRILNEELVDTLQRMQRMSEAQITEIGLRFGKKRSSILPHMENWTREGCLKMAQTLRSESRKQLDFNVVEGYALWMSSAWLEGAVRQSDSANAVFRHLDQFGKNYAMAMQRASKT